MALAHQAKVKMAAAVIYLALLLIITGVAAAVAVLLRLAQQTHQVTAVQVERVPYQAFQVRQ